MINRRTFMTIGTVGLVAGGTSVLTWRPALASQPLFYVGGKDGFAADGADVVAYRGLDAKAKGLPGTDAFTTEWNGATWRFATADNLAMFEADPEAFAPQYGGYCAWAVAQGYTAHGDIDAWHLQDGKLYLNYNNRIRTRWRKDIPGHIAQADANWPTILSA